MKTILICAAIVLACFINSSANAQAQVQTRVYTTTSAPTDSVGLGPFYINAYSQDAQTGAFSLLLAVLFCSGLAAPQWPWMRLAAFCLS